MFKLTIFIAFVKLMLAIRPGHIAQFVERLTSHDVYSCTFCMFDSTDKVTTLNPTK